MKKRILIVDDEKNIFDFFSRLLENKFILDYAKDGREGLILFSKNRYDLIITDNDMPAMSGAEMIKEIKKLNSKLPIIFITGDTSFVTEFNDIKVLYKPFSINKIKETIFPLLNLL